MSFAIELMNREPVTVSPDLSVRKLARLLLDQNLDGVCVVDQGKLVGVVTAMDLIFQERRVALPSYVALLNRLIPLNKARQSSVEKVVGGTVREIMSGEPIGVDYDASIDEIAALMVDLHITVLPVLKNESLVGVIYKRDLLRAALSSMGQDEA